MTTFTKASLRCLIATLCMANLTTIAMEYPQLQLQNPTKQNETTQVDCSVMICPMPRNRTVAYTFKETHNDLFKYNNIQSTAKDPIIYISITDNNNLGNNHVLPLPAKRLFNLTDKSVLQIYEANNDIFCKRYGHHKPFLINAICKINSQLEGDTVAEQFNNAMNKFYTSPSVQINEKNQKELENAGIIEINSEIKSSYPNITGTYASGGCFDANYDSHWMRICNSRNYSSGTFYVEVIKNLVVHGPNGCPDEKTLIKSIIDEKIPTNKNLFKSLMNRQINGK